MDYRYSIKASEKMAKASALSLPVSMKKTVEICNMIRGKNLQRAIRTLGMVVDGKQAVPYRRFNKGGTGHRKGMGTGRYPMKTCAEIIKLLENVRANAEQKGLQAPNLVISHIRASKGAKSFHYGRKRRRLLKRTHLEVAVEEAEQGKSSRTPEENAGIKGRKND
ncbi:50S ribosomal protein L22 [Candidatus Woesearchaeota archaeon]|nr:50S ribosomal protein L22 [Candidatus Woesearchaeota archaeon]